MALGIVALPAYFSLTYRLLGQLSGTFSEVEITELLTEMALDSILARPEVDKKAKRARQPKGPLTKDHRSPRSPRSPTKR